VICSRQYTVQSCLCDWSTERTSSALALTLLIEWRVCTSQRMAISRTIKCLLESFTKRASYLLVFKYIRDSFLAGQRNCLVSLQASVGPPFRNSILALALASSPHLPIGLKHLLLQRWLWSSPRQFRLHRDFEADTFCGLYYCKLIECTDY